MLLADTFTYTIQYTPETGYFTGFVSEIPDILVTSDFQDEVFPILKEKTIEYLENKITMYMCFFDIGKEDYYDTLGFDINNEVVSAPDYALDFKRNFIGINIRKILRPWFKEIN